MAKQHNRQYHGGGQQRMVAARVAMDTESTLRSRNVTYGTAPGIPPSGTSDTIDAPPPYQLPKEDSPVTYGHLAIGYKVLAAIGVIVVTVIIPAVWFLSGLSSKTEQNSDSIKQIEGKTEKLKSETEINAIKIQGVESRTTKLEDKIMTRAK